MSKFLHILIFLLVQISFLTAQVHSSPFKPGMGVKIMTYPDTSGIFSEVLMVNEVGEIDLPLVGVVNVSSMMKKDFEAYILKSYNKFLRISDVYVIVYMRITLLGGFENPGLYFVKQDETLWGVIKRAGGFLEEEGFKKMSVFRGDKKIIDNLADDYSKGLTLRQINIQSGDIITTPIPVARQGLLATLSQAVGVVATAVTVYFAYVATVINARRSR